MKDPFRQALEISRRSGPHVEDVRRLLVFHGLGYGESDSSALIEAKLADSSAFRSDISALARHISDLEQRPVTDEEMLTLIHLAAGGKQPFEEAKDSSIPAPDGELSTLHSAATDPQVSSVQPTPAPVPGPPPFFAADTGVTAPGEADISQRRLELALTELKLYLDDINRRIGRIEPQLEDISRIVQNSADRLQTPPRDGEPVLTGKPLLPEAPKPPTAPPLLRIEPDLKHRRLPSQQPVDPPLASAPAPASSLISEHAPDSAEHIAAAGTGQPGTRVGPAIALANAGSHRSIRETTGRVLAIVAVVLAIVGGIAAMYALDRSGEDARAAQPRTQVNQGTPITADPGRPAPDTPAPTPQPMATESAPPQIRSQDKSPRREPESSSAAQPKASRPLSPPVPQLPVARIAGKRSEPFHPEPRIEVLPSTQQSQRSAIALKSSPAQRVASQTEDEAVGVPAPNSAVSHGVGTPEVESHSSLGGALIASRKPVYPAEALRQHEEGTVVLDALIAKDGTVKRMDVVEGSPGFTRSALNAVSWWRYKPAHARGEAAETQARITVNYRIR